MTRDEALKAFLDYAEELEVNVKLFEEDYVVKVMFDFNNTSASFLIFFDNDGEGVQIMARDFAHVPKKVFSSITQIINKYNRKYRWIKLEWDETKENLYAQIDLLISGEDCGKIIWGMIFRLGSTIDTIIPQLMSDFWGSENREETAKEEESKDSSGVTTLDQMLKRAKEDMEDAS